MGRNCNFCPAVPRALLLVLLAPFDQIADPNLEAGRDGIDLGPVDRCLPRFVPVLSRTQRGEHWGSRFGHWVFDEDSPIRWVSDAKALVYLARVEHRFATAVVP